MDTTRNNRFQATLEPKALPFFPTQDSGILEYAREAVPCSSHARALAQGAGRMEMDLGQE